MHQITIIEYLGKAFKPIHINLSGWEKDVDKQPTDRLISIIKIITQIRNGHLAT